MVKFWGASYLCAHLVRDPGVSDWHHGHCTVYLALHR